MPIANGSTIEAGNLNGALVVMTNALSDADARKPTYVNIPIYANRNALSGSGSHLRTNFFIAPDNSRILSLRQFGRTNPIGETFTLELSQFFGTDSEITSEGDTTSTSVLAPVNAENFATTNGQQFYFSRGGTYQTVFTNTKASGSSNANASLVVQINKREN